LEAERLEDDIDKVDIDEVKIMEAEHRSVKRDNPDAIFESPSADETDGSRPEKRHRNQGGNKSKKPKRNHNNKSKRRQRKYHSN
jgi:hypothetical protein